MQTQLSFDSSDRNGIFRLTFCVANFSDSKLLYAFFRHGVISTPELTGWRVLTANDSYLVVASDGIFESLTPDDICDFIGHQKSGLSSSSSLADCIVDIAFEKGSTDNLSVIVVPLTSK